MAGASTAVWLDLVGVLHTDDARNCVHVVSLSSWLGKTGFRSRPLGRHRPVVDVVDKFFQGAVVQVRARVADSLGKMGQDTGQRLDAGPLSLPGLGGGDA